MFKKDIIGFFTLSLLAILTGFLVNFLSPVGIEWIGSWDKTKNHTSAKTKNQQLEHAVELNNPFKIRELVKKKETLIIDVRIVESYNQGHIPGAVSMPLNEFDQIIDKFIKSTPPDTALIVYCSRLECSDSHTFALRLENNGFTNITIYKGGMMEWENMGFKVESE